MAVVESEAFLLRAVPYGEADVVATFLLRSHGKMAAMARGARRSKKRFPGVLEPLSTAVVRLEDRGRDLGTLKEGRVTIPRIAIMTDLDALDAAGRALRFARELCPPKIPEPEVFEALTRMLDRLENKRPPKITLLRFSFTLLSATGYGLELSRCVRCGRPRPKERAAHLDANVGGVVCSSCGGGKYTLNKSLTDVAEKLTLGQFEDDDHASDGTEEALSAALDGPSVDLLLRVTEEAILAHAGVSV